MFHVSKAQYCFYTDIIFLFVFVFLSIEQLNGPFNFRPIWYKLRVVNTPNTDTNTITPTFSPYTPNNPALTRYCKHLPVCTNQLNVLVNKRKDGTFILRLQH